MKERPIAQLPYMDRRTFIAQAGAGLAGAILPSFAYEYDVRQSPGDVTLEIAPLELEIGSGKVVQTIAYNGRVPGPLIRWPEGKAIVIDVHNQTSVPEIVHWHGLQIPPEMDGAAEEGSPMIPSGGRFRYAFTPRPAGFRWYHTHAFAGHDLKRGTYTGQFGCFYIDPRSNPGAYDQEIFLTMHDWNAYLAGGGDSSMDAAYDYSTIDGHMLGFGDPLKVREGQRVLLHLLNASASMIHWLALAGHELTVVAMDGNPVPTPSAMPAIRLGPAERVDVLITMNHPGIWILGETRDGMRKMGMGIVIEYAYQQAKPRWLDPPETLWDYRRFAKLSATTRKPDQIIPLVFESKFHGQGAVASWTINGKSFSHTEAIALKEGLTYRLQMINRSAEDHPVHLHRHTFEVTSLNSQPLSGLNKDVVVVPANMTVEADFMADNPGATLFHCHNQTHMDFGFMTLLRYA
jgi:FtsP/CotA-like multicopper oxidase with cupredoxin domain